MLFEPAGRADEIQGVNIEDLDFAGRPCQVKAKGTKARSRRRGQTREDFALETGYWDAGTARLLPRLLKGRNRGPVFVTHRHAGPERIVSPGTGARTPGSPGSRTGRPAPCSTSTPPYAGRVHGWHLHEYRHPCLTHLGEQCASLLMLKAKSRHRKPENGSAAASSPPGGHRRTHQPACAG
ncbi:site-specific integrase [Streptomyces phaeoluteigriseus]|uniref:Site-specific integrase n=1 Tax=Streptomyces phaeoluteigriseus TaxID=114686 RepID=A0ABY4ZBL7_9ACTN|nr:site-specific integrase [Streptomyces phaeoluteigriseus]USQ86085.1 site-specific integrase [Streptomyces phaeoluteigriseus]